MKKAPSPEEEYHKIIGLALSEWAIAEVYLCGAFRDMSCSQTGTIPLDKAFWAIVSFEAKLKMVNATFLEAFKNVPDYLAKWNSINEKLAARSIFRNKLAHGSVITYPYRNSSGKELIDVFVAPYFFKSWGELKGNIHDMRPVDRLYIAEINVFLEGVAVVKKELLDLSVQFRQEQIWPRGPILLSGEQVVLSYRLPEPPTPKVK